MEVTLIMGAVFLLLILVCWIVYRRSRQSSWRNVEMHERIHPNINVADVDGNERTFADDVELGPVITAQPEDWAPQTFTDDMDDDDAEMAEFLGWDYEAEDDADLEPVESDNGIAEPNGVYADEEYTQHASDASVEPTEPVEYEYESLAHIEPEEFDTLEPVDSFGRSKVEPTIGIQTHLPLRTTEINGHTTNGATEPMIEHVDVDESVQFPEFRETDNQILDMLGWIPANGTPVSHMQLLALMRSFGEKFETPVTLYGHLEDSEDWTKLDDDDITARFTDLMFTLQLTHRGKAIDEQCWWRFFNMGEQIAKSLSRPFYPSLSMESALKLSSNLTEQVGNLNLQAILILQSENGRQLSHRTLEYLAREYQLIMRDEGQIFEKPDLFPQNQNNVPIYTLTTILPEQPGITDTEEVGLALCSDLPCVRDPLDAFDQMVDLAKSLEDRFPLTLVDEARRKVTTRDIEIIRTHIMRFVDDMEFCGIEPGGDKAIRLFGDSLVQQFDREVSQLAHLDPNF